MFLTTHAAATPLTAGSMSLPSYLSVRTVKNSDSWQPMPPPDLQRRARVLQTSCYFSPRYNRDGYSFRQHVPCMLYCHRCCRDAILLLYVNYSFTPSMPSGGDRSYRGRHLFHLTILLSTRDETATLLSSAKTILETHTAPYYSMR